MSNQPETPASLLAEAEKILYGSYDATPEQIDEALKLRERAAKLARECPLCDGRGCQVCGPHRITPAELEQEEKPAIHERYETLCGWSSDALLDRSPDGVGAWKRNRRESIWAILEAEYGKPAVDEFSQGQPADQPAGITVGSRVRVKRSGDTGCVHGIYPRLHRPITILFDETRPSSVTPDNALADFTADELELLPDQTADATAGQPAQPWPFGDATVLRCGQSVIYRKDWDALIPAQPKQEPTKGAWSIVIPHANSEFAVFIQQRDDQGFEHPIAKIPRGPEYLWHTELIIQSRAAYLATGLTPSQLAEALAASRANAAEFALERERVIQECARLKEELAATERSRDEWRGSWKAANKHLAAITKERDALTAEVARIRAVADAHADTIREEGERAIKAEEDRDAAVAALAG